MFIKDFCEECLCALINVAPYLDYEEDNLKVQPKLIPQSIVDWFLMSPLGT
jgi:hypothetical protein